MATLSPAPVTSDWSPVSPAGRRETQRMTYLPDAHDAIVRGPADEERLDALRFARGQRTGGNAALGSGHPHGAAVAEHLDKTVLIKANQVLPALLVL